MAYNLKFSPVEFRESLDRLRSKGVAVANEQTSNSRLAMAGLIDGDAKPTTITIATLVAYGNPTTPKGKAVETLSGLRYASGGDAARKSLEACFTVYELCDTEGALAIIGKFIDAEKDAPKGIFALRDAVKALAKAAMGEAAADGGPEAGSEQESDKPTASESLADRVAAIVAEIENAPVSELAAASEALSALYAAIEFASARIEAAEIRKAA